MTTPDPMTPPECDLQKLGLPLPIDTMALLHRDMLLMSNHILAPHIRLLGWAWESRPTGSLLNNNRRLACLAMVSDGTWKRNKDAILTGFVLCSDGRLYHRYLCKVALGHLRSPASEPQLVRRARLGVTTGQWARLRREVFARDDGCCSYCGISGVRLECDHVIPLAKGGTTTLENLVAACGPCNRSKSSLSVEEWFR